MSAYLSQVSKTEFKARALELCRQVEDSAQPLLITDHGRPTLELRPCQPMHSPLLMLRETVVRYDNPLEPVDVDWYANL